MSNKVVFNDQKLCLIQVLFWTRKGLISNLKIAQISSLHKKCLILDTVKKVPFNISKNILPYKISISNCHFSPSDIIYHHWYKRASTRAKDNYIVYDAKSIHRSEKECDDFLNKNLIKINITSVGAVIKGFHARITPWRGKARISVLSAIHERCAILIKLCHNRRTYTF